MQKGSILGWVSAGRGKVDGKDERGMNIIKIFFYSCMKIEL
jgi:hypothetical protein